MKRETPEQKWDRIQRQIQDGITKGYPNPDRKGCLVHERIAALATRSVNPDNRIEDDTEWQHVTHCSPCYREYLDEFEKRRADKRSTQPK